MKNTITRENFWNNSRIDWSKMGTSESMPELIKEALKRYFKEGETSTNFNQDRSVFYLRNEDLVVRIAKNWGIVEDCYWSLQEQEIYSETTFHMGVTYFKDSDDEVLDLEENEKFSVEIKEIQYSFSNEHEDSITVLINDYEDISIELPVIEIKNIRKFILENKHLFEGASIIGHENRKKFEAELERVLLNNEIEITEYYGDY